MARLFGLLGVIKNLAILCILIITWEVLPPEFYKQTTRGHFFEELSKIHYIYIIHLDNKNISIMLKKILICLSLFFHVTVSASGSISEDKARNIASKYLLEYGKTIRYNGRDISDNELYYVFEIETGGFVIVSKEDLFKNPVLYFCTNITYNDTNIPSEVGNIISKLPDVIAKARETYFTRKLASPGEGISEEKPTIAPLIKTEWAQGHPYNDALPDSAVTGCGATALAQILYYHRYPEACDSVPSHVSYGGQVLPSLEPTSFDYSKMKGTYCDEDDASEVAKLMKYCGHAMETDYHKDESGTLYSSMLPALKFFKFSAEARALDGNYYDFRKWMDDIYAELREGRPVIIGGCENKGDNIRGDGHWFICDGYYNGNYHFNMGWGESAVNTESYDPIFDYSMDKMAIVGIKKPNILNFAKGQLEITNPQIHSTYCINDLSEVNFIVTNHGNEAYVGNIYMSGTMLSNQTGPTRVNGMLSTLVGDSLLRIEPKQEVKLSYTFSNTVNGDYQVWFSTKEGEALDTISYHVGGYTNRIDDMNCRFNFLSFFYYDEQNGIYYLDPGLNEVELYFVNYGNETYRGMVQTRITNNTFTDPDTLTYNGDRIIEVPAGKSTYPIRYTFNFNDFDIASYWQIGISPQFGTVQIKCIPNLEIRTSEGVLRMDEKDRNIPAEALNVFMEKYHPDTINTEEANPNCLYFTNCEDYRPIGVSSNLVINGESDSIHIDSNRDFYVASPVISEVAEFRTSFSRTEQQEDAELRNAKSKDDFAWKCMMFPFDPEEAYLPEGTDLMQSDSMEIYELGEHLNAVQVTEIKANVPYLIGIRTKDSAEVTFKSRNVTIPPSVNIEKNTDYGTLVSSPIQYSCLDPFDFFRVYRFNPKSMAFQYDDYGILENQSPFTVTLMNNDFSKDVYMINFITAVNDYECDEERQVNLYNPLGIHIGIYKFENGKLDDFNDKGIYISKGKKYLFR